MRSGLIAAALMAACGSQPDLPTEADRALAMSIVWVDAFQMASAEAPDVAIVRSCPTESDGVIAPSGSCFASGIKYDTGELWVTWTGRFSTSLYAQSLAIYARYLVTGFMLHEGPPHDYGDAIGRGNRALEARGL